MGDELMFAQRSSRSGDRSQVELLSGDPSDDEIITAALSADAEILVSGDRRHVLPLGTVHGMRILRPQELLRELAAP